ncbi:MAG: prepilin-type N-terminal cleavage/methylation domain-containing protein [Planctomycetota bacterium]
MCGHGVRVVSRRAVYRQRGLTLVEAVMAMIIVGVVGAVVAPLTLVAAEAYGEAANIRDTADDTAYAMERAVRLIREAPQGEEAGEVGITAAGPSNLAFGDGRGLRLDGDALLIVDTAGNASVLCRGVSTFELTYIGGDGASDTALTPALTRRVNIRLVVNGFELVGAAFVRVAVGV